MDDDSITIESIAALVKYVNTSSNPDKKVNGKLDVFIMLDCSSASYQIIFLFDLHFLSSYQTKMQKVQRIGQDYHCMFQVTSYECILVTHRRASMNICNDFPPFLDEAPACHPFFNIFLSFRNGIFYLRNLS